MIFAAFLGLAAAPGAAYGGALVVIASTVPEFRVGAVIDGRYPINLRGGTSVTFVSADGRTLKISGPFAAAPDPSAGARRTELLSALSDIVTRPRKDTSSAGIMRAGLHGSDSPWVIDSGRNGAYCVRLDQPLRLWRAMAIGTVSASLQSYSLGGAAVKWTDGSYEAGWPATLPLRDGETYQLRFRNTRRVRNLTVHLMPRDLTTDALRLVWMHRRGCRSQARTLLARLRG